MSSKSIQICDVCHKEINFMTELYEELDSDNDVFEIRKEFVLADNVDICESCTNKLKEIIYNGIRDIRNDDI